jgi:uncharacterized protein YndB with AHSA1/START domain
MTMPARNPKIDDAAVKTATGKDWVEWMDLLAAAGLEAGAHAAVADFLDHEHSVPSWWRQAIASRFERSTMRGGREALADGFEVEVEATLPAGPEAVYRLWTDDELRTRWLRRADLELTDLRPPGRIRAKWLPGDSELEVSLESGAEAGSTSMRLRHWKLPSAQAAEKLERFWKMVVDRMREHVID